MCVFIFVISKQPQDLFRNFSKRPDIQFSLFQYPHFFYAEQRLKLQTNSALIEKRLGKGGQLLAVLDEDDILNAEETIRREQMGIDIDFLVRHVG